MRNHTPLLGALLLTACVAPAQMIRINGSENVQKDPYTGIPVRVRLTEFLIGTTEVTQEEFQQIAGYNPSSIKGAKLPVHDVSWWDAIRYCNLRSSKEGLKPAYDLGTGECDLKADGYRLPTEAEWALAAGAPPKTASTQSNLGPASTKTTAPFRAGAHSPKPVRASEANANGLYDVWGNVWEWCTDFHDPARNLPVLDNPRGAVRGLARILRGGSYISTTSNWSRGYRSSMPPDLRSRFTGFRVARSIVVPTRRAEPNAEWWSRFDQPPAKTIDAPAPAPLVAAGISISTWKQKREAIRSKWNGILGRMSADPFVPSVREIERLAEPNLDGRLMELQVERDWWEKILVLRPAGSGEAPLPVVIVPYYDVDVPAGVNLGGRTYMPPGVRAFAAMAAQRGFAAVAIRWFGESYGEGSAEVVANLTRRHPEATGLGKWVWDASRLLDWLETMPWADRSRIGIIGHSLGAKMSLYAAAMDERISAVVFSEGGIGLSFSNYDDFWYLGEKRQSMPAGTDQHELLALIAPRPFLLIAGEDADGDKSWPYVTTAREVYRLYGSPRDIGWINHRSGHTPTADSVGQALEWLEYQLRRDQRASTASSDR